MMGVIADLTERKRAEEALRESEERYRTLFEQSRDAIFIAREGRVLDVNQAALDMFGYTREKALDVLVRDVYVSAADQGRMRQQLLEHGAVQDFEARLRKNDGTEFDGLFTATRYQLEDDRAPITQGIIHDITERKRAEETLRDLAVLEERNRMAREIHDTMAQGFTGIVLQLEAAEQAFDQTPLEVPDHLSRAKTLARECLQEARRSVWNLLPKTLEERPLTDALDEMVQEFDSGGRAKADFSVSGERRELAGDVQVTLLRICQESLTNIKRHAAATEVTVDLAFRPDVIRLGIQDNGGGFDQEEYRNQGRRGGFGLTGMEQRARLVRGTLNVKSQKGMGTTVEVAIPI